MSMDFSHDYVTAERSFFLKDFWQIKEWVLQRRRPETEAVQLSGL